ncbi:MAG: hypothetical protein OXQ93_15965 [Gemmatimonadota bacterium]|nr:hypothetical protein [Gemmatimonadota bacterium]
MLSETTCVVTMATAGDIDLGAAGGLGTGRTTCEASESGDALPGTSTEGCSHPIGSAVKTVGTANFSVMKTVISTNGLLSLPAELLEHDAIVPGQEFEIERLGAGIYRLARTGRPGNADLVDWLLACPEEDWFVPVPSESTADF